MANTFTSLHYHVVFSTKGREPWLRSDVRARLWPYLGGIARDNGMHAWLIGGVEDHVHLLVSIPPALAVAKAIQTLKGTSLQWVKQTFRLLSFFAWQDGYGAFTVSHSQLEAVREYIATQEEHQRIRTFAEEYRAFLVRHGVAFDERYLLG